MQILFLVLGLAWAAYLAQVLFRRRAARPSAIGDYRRTLSLLPGFRGDDVVMGSSLGRSVAGFGPSRSVSAARARRARKRRRDVFLGLSATALGTFVVGLLPGFRIMLAVSLTMVVALGLFAMALVRMRMPAQARLGSRSMSPAYAYAFAGDADDRDQRYDSRFEARNDSRYDSRSDARHDSRYDTRYDSRFDDRYESRFDGRYESRFDTGYDVYEDRSRRNSNVLTDWD
jgi:hypothetical protein